MSATATVRHTVLETSEWRLVVELLERECRSLPLEIHQATAKESRQILRDRLKRAEDLLGKVRLLAS